MTTPFLSAWTDWECNGGDRICDLEYSSLGYGGANDNTQTLVATVPANDATALAAASMANVMRVQNELGAVSEAFISNLDKRRNAPVFKIIGKPVELMLNRAVVRDVNGQRQSTVISNSLSASDWITQYIIPSLAIYGQPWWLPGTCTVDEVFPLNFADQTCMWLIRQILQKRPESLIGERFGGAGYYLHLKVPAPTASPRATVGDNVLALTVAIDDTTQATDIIPRGMTFPENDEGDTCWYTPMRAAAVAGTVVSLEDPSGVGMMILAEDIQPFLSTNQPEILGMDWRLGCIVPPVRVSTSSPLWRSAYVSPTLVWEILSSGIRSLNLETRALGTLLTTSLTGPRDAVYNGATGKLYVVDLNGNRVTPYTGTSAGTPIAMGTGPRRAFRLIDTGFDQILIGHSGSNNLKQIDPSTDTVSASSTAMTTPTHIAAVSKTQVYIGSDGGDLLYRFNASTNTLVSTLVGGATVYGYSALAYDPTLHQLWACQRDYASVPPTGGITIWDTTTDTIVATIVTTGIHATVNDGYVLNGRFYGVTDDGEQVCYVCATHTLDWVYRPGASPSTVALNGLDRVAALDCVLLAGAGGSLHFVDAQTGGATIARKLTAASAATPSVTLQNSIFPVRQYDEVVFCRDDGDPLFEIPNTTAALLYGVKVRQVVSPNLNSGSNRALNGDLTWFDSSRKAIRFGNLSLKDATCEAKWDGYDNNAVTAFSMTVNGTQATVGNTPNTFNFSGAGAGRVFLPGDLLLGTATFIVAAKATADGSGNVGIYAIPTGAAGIVNGATVNVSRPNGSALLEESPTWLALPQITVASGGARSAIFADVNLPFIPGEMRNLYWGMEGYTFGIGANPADWRVRVLGVDSAATLLDVQPNPDTVALNGRGLVPMLFDGSIPLPDAFAGGHMQLNVQPILSDSGTGVYTLYVKRLWVQVGNDSRGAPSDGAARIFDFGQRNAVLRGQPAVSYTVEVLETDPDNPFVLGATVTLNDPEQGIYGAQPTIINITRPLPRFLGELIRPVLTLESRPPSLIRFILSTTSNQG